MKIPVGVGHRLRQTCSSMFAYRRSTVKQSRWHGASAVTLLLAACNPLQLPSDPPSGYEFESPPPVPPQDAALIAAQLDPILLEILSLDPVELFTSFEDQRITLGEAPTDVEPPEGESNCPQYDMERLADEGVFAWDSRGTCDPSNNNARFQGSGESISVFNFLEDIDDPNSAFINRILAVAATARIFEDRNITDGTGPRFDISMLMEYVEAVPTEGSADLSTSAILSGNVFWNGTGSGAVWLSERYSLDVDIRSEVQGANKQVFLRGIVSGLQNPLIDAIKFNDVVMTLATFPDSNDPAVTLSTCFSEPAGSFEVRDINGYWYLLNFQGSRNFDSEAGGNCNNSGDLLIINDPINNPIETQTSQPITPTFTGLSDWEGRPWR
jgi:hypothetical protein